LDPFGGRIERAGIEGDQVLAPIAAATDQGGLLQHPQVFGDRIEGHLEGPRHIGDARFAVRQADQDRPARGVGQGMQRLVEHNIHPIG
jgi:hypothetical protein